MSDGEKKRFGNFAEYAQARKEQQGMPGMSGPGIGNNNDQSRFMQSFGSSSGSGQQPGLNGNMMGGMMQQQQQDLQQRGMAPGSGLGGGGGLGMQQNPMNRSGLGMGLGNMQGGGGRGGGAQGGAGGGGGGMGGRVGMQGGGAGGMGSIGGVARPGNIGGGGMGGGGGGGVQQGYGDGGDLLALLNKGGMGGAALNVSGGQPLPAGMNRGGMSGLAPGGQGPVGSGPGGEGGVPGMGSSQTEFSMEEDFPALPGASSGQGPNNSLMSGSASGSHGIVEQFQRMKMEGGVSDNQGPGMRGGMHDKQDKYGMLGLLDVIRMENENLTFVALGTDLTTLGLNLNAAENLHETFMSPFVNNSQARTPDYQIPRCYYITPPALKTAFFTKFSDTTLFYIFYHFLTRPSDAPHQELRTSLVKYAYQELQSNRGWQYQQEGNLWLKRNDSNQVVYFDLNKMEILPFVHGQSGSKTPPNSEGAH